MKHIKIGILFIVLFVTFNFDFSVWAADLPKWYEENRLVAHALGGIEGRIETNSKEAFINAYENGYKVMEVDLTLTSDGNLVARHDFDQDSYFRLEQVVQNANTQMDINRYTKEKINFKYTPLTADDLIRLMDEYKDVYLITDSKYTDPAYVTQEFNKLVATAQSLGMTSVLDRFVIQIYNQDMYKVIKDIFPFDNWIFTLYQLQDPDYDAIATFCADNQIEVVTMNYEIVEYQNVRKLTDRGLKVYAHTVNRFLDYQNLMGAGCYGIYTDIITPYELSYINMAPKKKNGTRAFVAGQKTMTVGTYMIQQEEYIKLRDMARVLEGTNAEFDVVIDDTQKTIQLTTNKKYIPDGTEFSLAFPGEGMVKINLYQVKINGQDSNLKGYTVDDQLYFKAEDLGTVLGFEVQQDSYGAKKINFSK